jgi:hypothetical protein
VSHRHSCTSTCLRTSWGSLACYRSCFIGRAPDCCAAKSRLLALPLRVDCESLHGHDCSLGYQRAKIDITARIRGPKRTASDLAGTAALDASDSSDKFVLAVGSRSSCPQYVCCRMASGVFSSRPPLRCHLLLRSYHFLRSGQPSGAVMVLDFFRRIVFRPP